MLLIPIQRDAESYDLFLVLQPDNLERVQQHDPCDARLHIMDKRWRQMQLREIMIGYADKDDIDAIQDMARRGESTAEIERYLSRGYRWQPEHGDGGRVTRTRLNSAPIETVETEAYVDSVGRVSRAVASIPGSEAIRQLLLVKLALEAGGSIVVEGMDKPDELHKLLYGYELKVGGRGNGRMEVTAIEKEAEDVEPAPTPEQPANRPT